ncbi:hypothetical protein, conserved [Entamoeba dispar SAW760]|uniref:RING-type domain-containing protein n=1 Tax=Entamoeba dispar (strain ATCC PRA-260 / SAW760) TaxID=370354 RepID=B0EBL9_ENTDS|nr:uncharacterized protein EDI_324980 [Entamoeba dispar SAW760]EDR28031.1 hypothetical protein, conserved [Entamoeba dispar SAW760]|eukprot:EDR28031.1 hypothetical protein, conserved [Entamoeba dispar SAW760]
MIIIEYYEEQEEILCECVENGRKEQEKNNKEIFCCNICYEEYTCKETFINTYGHRFCINCWRENIIQQIQNDWHQVYCMEQGCLCTVKIEDIMTHCLIRDINMFNMYSERLTFKTFEDNICECPKCQCEMISFDKEYKTTCPNVCICFVENVENNGMKEKFVMNGQHTNNRNKKIWNGLIVIQKNVQNGGCNHMTRKCGYKFCWLCCVKYTPEQWMDNTTGRKQFT